jgi:putative endonuclease
MAKLPPSHYPDIGQFGEDLVAQWLQSTGWVILHRRFSCRWGEIDIIAEHHEASGEEQKSKGEYPTPHSLLPTPLPILAFIEVKTRSSGSWDAGGRSAITPQKQAKIWRTAEIFLSQYPDKADYPCRFDVAIVSCQRIPKNKTGVTATPEALATSSAGEYKFKLQEYILAAFDSLIDHGSG